MQEDVLRVAGLYKEGVPAAQLFQQVEPRIVDLATGEVVASDKVEPAAYDPKLAVKDNKLSVAIDPEKDLAGLKRREKYAEVYVVKGDDGNVSQIILPVRGKGLWSTMYGFLSLDADLRTVHGITFYEHGETPGLGGEIENPRWKSKWRGKVAIDQDGNPQLESVRGEVGPDTTGADHKIDGLAGATLTTRGVTNTVRYWLGSDGFGPFLEKQRKEIRP
jgi:Na+-transporting NADH:ubiquinone oxidoreductase subunit C